jgi:hypothetical protein
MNIDYSPRKINVRTALDRGATAHFRLARRYPRHAIGNTRPAPPQGRRGAIVMRLVAPRFSRGGG